MADYQVGDWVRDLVNNKVVRLGNHYHKGGIEPWTPQPGEWCWFWDDERSTDGAYLSTFVEYVDEYILAGDDSEWDHCEPFIGTLPTIVKEES